MQLNRKVTRLAASVLATAMFACATALPAMAEAPTATATLTKKLTKAANAYAPNTNFTFKIEQATSADLTNGVTDKVIYSGPEGGVTFEGGSTEGTITSEPQGSDLTHSEITVGTLNLVYNKNLFTKAGVYRYKITETAGSYDGIEYDTTARYFDVYVTNAAAGGLDVTYATFVDANDSTAKDDGIFTNDYATDASKTLTVHKVVEGNLGDKTKSFDFSVKIDGETGEQYYVTYGDGKTETLTSGTAKTISLKDGQSLTVFGLSKNDQYTVSETDYTTTDGYTTKVVTDPTDTTNSETAGAVRGSSVEDQKVSDTADDVYFYNIKNYSTPTGVIMNVAPYVLMVGIAVAGCFVFLRKRRDD